jgi:hypothetical protein
MIVARRSGKEDKCRLTRSREAEASGSTYENGEIHEDRLSF